MYVITGAGGQTGSVAARTLLEAGSDVTVVLHSDAKRAEWERAGATVAIADVTDSQALAAILRGAEGAYLMNPPAYASTDTFEEARRVGRALAEAVRNSDTEHIVVLSSLGAERAEGTGQIGTSYVFDNALGETGRPTTILRCAMFMQNFAAQLQPAREQGIFPSMMHPLDRQLEMISATDIGTLAAQILREGPRGDGVRVVELLGPALYAPNDVATAFGKTLGKAVSAVAVPREQWVPILEGSGMHRNVAELLAQMYDGINGGRIAILDGVEVRRGTTTLDAAIARLAA